MMDPGSSLERLFCAAFLSSRVHIDLEIKASSRDLTPLRMARTTIQCVGSSSLQLVLEAWREEASKLQSPTLSDVHFALIMKALSGINGEILRLPQFHHLSTIW